MPPRVAARKEEDNHKPIASMEKAKKTVGKSPVNLAAALLPWLVLLLFAPMLSSCYNQSSATPDAWDLTKRQIDSISFSTTHHYSQNYNFVVKADSLLPTSCHSIPSRFTTATTSLWPTS